MPDRSLKIRVYFDPDRAPGCRDAKIKICPGFASLPHACYAADDYLACGNLLRVELVTTCDKTYAARNRGGTWNR